MIAIAGVFGQDGTPTPKGFSGYVTTPLGFGGGISASWRKEDQNAAQQGMPTEQGAPAASAQPGMPAQQGMPAQSGM